MTVATWTGLAAAVGVLLTAAVLAGGSALCKALERAELGEREP